MEAIIYKTTLSDFIKELHQRSSARFFIYITTTKTQREKGVWVYELVLSAFNLQNRVVYLRAQICKVSMFDSEANAKAETRTKQQAEKVKKKLLESGFYVNSGIIGSLEKPVFGIIDEVSEPTGAND